MEMKILERNVDTEFKKHKRNVYSQWGEDGILEFLIERAQISLEYFVEFGAWDGRHLSNSAYLAEKGCAGCFIEGDSARFKDLLRNYGDNQKISKLNRYVGWAGENSLDCLLDQVGAPRNITVLSIDIDGNDYAVWEEMVHHDADITVIEFNPTIPPHIVFVQERDEELNFGNSLAALFELGERKGCVLVATTETNAIFLKRDLAEKSNIESFKPWDIKDVKYETVVFHGYDGVLKVAGNQELLWHGVPIFSGDFQPLPLELRKIPAGQSDSYYQTFDQFKAELEAK